jgi:hypothetical protein
LWQGFEYLRIVSFVNFTATLSWECVPELKKGAAAIETPSVITAMISSIIFWEGSGGGIGAKVD